jgi:hypothetical protein
MKYLDVLPKSFGLDMVILFVMQGNDYLPKIRGLTIERTLLSYGNVMKLLPPEKRYLLDMERNTFNFVALYLLMSDLRCNDVQLHVNIPKPTLVLNEIFQRSKDEVVWLSENINDTDTVNGGAVGGWGASISINGKRYDTNTTFDSKSAARSSLSASLLQQMWPEKLAEMYVNRERAYGLLLEYQRAVISEEREQLLALRELVLCDDNREVWSRIVHQDAAAPEATYSTSSYAEGEAKCSKENVVRVTDDCNNRVVKDADHSAETYAESNTDCVSDEDDSGTVREAEYTRYVRYCVR